MPVTPCSEDGKPGFRAAPLKDCPSCKCFTYEMGNEQSRQRALGKANKQLQAIKASQNAAN